MLGLSVKVLILKENKNVVDWYIRVICVFIENYDDCLDVERIENKLREFGIINKLLYKLDSLVGKYEKDGYKDVIEKVSYLKNYCEELV